MAHSYKYGIHDGLSREALLFLIFIEETGKQFGGR